MAVETIFVAGAGTMGAGIAQVAAQGGYRVALWDLTDEALARGQRVIEKSLARFVEKGVLTAEERDAVLERITTGTDKAAAAAADLVIEAIVEDLEVKRGLFRELDALCKDTCLFATNTSSLSVTDMAVSTGRPDRFVGMHFFNPVPMMRLCEVVRTPLSADASVDSAFEVAEKMGKTPLRAKDTPGFLFNRLIIPYLNEAAWAVYEGVGSAEDIDQAMKLGGNMPIGPLALLDLVGIDVQEKVCDVFYKEFGDPKFRCCPLVRQMARAGFHGRKTGKGFYEYGEGR